MSFEEKKAAFVRAFAQLSVTEQEQILLFISDHSAGLDAQQEQAQEDARVDATFAEIMASVNW